MNSFLLSSFLVLSRRVKYPLFSFFVSQLIITERQVLSKQQMIKITHLQNYIVIDPLYMKFYSTPPGTRAPFLPCLLPPLTLTDSKKPYRLSAASQSEVRVWSRSIGCQVWRGRKFDCNNTDRGISKQLQVTCSTQHSLVSHLDPPTDAFLCSSSWDFLLKEVKDQATRTFICHLRYCLTCNLSKPYISYFQEPLLSSSSERSPSRGDRAQSRTRAEKKRTLR